MSSSGALEYRKTPGAKAAEPGEYPKSVRPRVSDGLNESDEERAAGITTYMFAQCDKGFLKAVRNPFSSPSLLVNQFVTVIPSSENG